MRKIQEMMFSMLFAVSTIFGKWDRTWTGNCRLFAIGSVVAAEHTASDGIRTISWGRGSVMDAREVADALITEGEKAWAARASEFELMSALRIAVDLRKKFHNRQVLNMIDEKIEIIESQAEIRRLAWAESAVRKYQAVI